MDRAALRIAVLASKATLRRWVRNSGGKAANAGRYFAVALIGAPIAGVAIAVWIAPKLEGLWPAEFAPVATVLIAGGIAGLVMILKAMDLEGSDAARGIAALPLGTGVRALCVYLPLLALFVVLALGAGPPLVVALDGVSALSPVGLGAAVLLLNVHALFWGLALVGTARVLVRKARLTRAATYPVAVLLWIGTVVAAYARARDMGAGDERTAATAALDTVLGSPAIFRAASEGSAAALLLAAVSVVVASTAAFFLTIRPTGAAAGMLGEPHQPVRLVWSSRGRAPLARLHALRLLRNRHVAGSAAASVALLVLGGVYIERVGGSNVDAARSMLFPLSLAVAHAALVSRGLSSRHRPYPLTLGLSPERWAGSVVLAALVPAYVAWLAFVSVVAVIVGDAETLLIGAGLGVFVLGAAVAVGSIFVPGRENAGGEIAALVVTSVATLSSAQVLHALGIGGDGAIALALGGVGCLLFAVPPGVERIRWSRDVGSAA